MDSHLPPQEVVAVVVDSARVNLDRTVLSRGANHNRSVDPEEHHSLLEVLVERSRLVDQAEPNRLVDRVEHSQAVVVSKVDSNNHVPRQFQFCIMKT